MYLSTLGIAHTTFSLRSPSRLWSRSKRNGEPASQHRLRLTGSDESKEITHELIFHPPANHEPHAAATT